MAARWIFLLISLLLPHGLIFQGPMANFPVSDCGVSKRCVGSPDSGCLRSGICRELLKYSYDTNADKVRIELFGTPPAPGSTNFWVALGVNQQPGQMAGTLVSECVYNNGAVQAFASFNADSGYSNRRLPPGQEKLGISNDRGAFSNGILSCSFLLDRVRTTNGHDFALDTPLYLVLGDGPADGNTIKPHQTTPWTSEQPLVLTMGQPQTSFPNLQGLQTIAPVRTTAGQAVPLTAGGFIRQSAAASAPPAAITGCAALKGCLAEPAGCLDNGNCNTVASYRLDPNRPGEMVFELWRVMAPAGDQYVAMGLNPTSPSMAKTGVIACVDAQNTVDVLASYNPSYYSTAVDNPKEGITVLQTGADGTHLYCQFSVQSNKSFRGSFAGSPANVDLNNPLYMVLAYGPATPNGILRKHSTAPLVSSGQVRLTDVAVSGVANKDYYKAHAGLMVGAWMFLASVGIFTARYYKPMWPGTKPCGLPVWFHIHRPIMILAISAAIAAFVLIFVQVRAWTATPVSVNPHPIIGIIAFGLGLIQPIMAIFRPHPGTANRPIFNWAHRLVGFSAHILAIAAIFLGLMMPQMNVLGGRDYGAAFWIMVAYAAFHVLWLILLQLIDWIAPLVGGGRRTTTMQMKTVNGHGTVYEETVIQEPVKAPASTLKTILWFTHFIVVAGLTIAILVLIGIST